MEKMEFTTTKEFILQAHKSACTDWKKRIEKEFPEAFKTELDVNKWYKSNDYPKHIFFVTEIKNDIYYYYGFNSGGEYKSNDWYSFFDLGLQNGFELATQEEIESALIVEAKKRFGEDWENAKVKECLHHGCENYINVLSFYTVVNEYSIWNRNAMIFNNGFWAEPLIEEKTTISKEKALKIIAKKLKVSPENIIIE